MQSSNVSTVKNSRAHEPGRKAKVAPPAAAAACMTNGVKQCVDKTKLQQPAAGDEDEAAFDETTRTQTWDRRSRGVFVTVPVGWSLSLVSIAEGADFSLACKAAVGEKVPGKVKKNEQVIAWHSPSQKPQISMILDNDWQNSRDWKSSNLRFTMIMNKRGRLGRLDGLTFDTEKGRTHSTIGHDRLSADETRANEANKGQNGNAAKNENIDAIDVNSPQTGSTMPTVREPSLASSVRVWLGPKFTLFDSANVAVVLPIINHPVTALL
jgi:hypothetical protein